MQGWGLLRPQDTDDASSLLLGGLLYLTNVGQPAQHLFDQPSAFFFVGQFPASEHDRNLDFMFAGQEIAGMMKFDVDVIFSCARPKPDFFELHLMVGKVFVEPLFLKVFILPIIHDSADRRVFIGSHFYQIEFGLPGQF